jgi:hypothetical protein
MGSSETQSQSHTQHGHETRLLSVNTAKNNSCPY